MSLKIQNLSLAIDSKLILEDLSLKLTKSHKTTFLFGPNGSGKSTLSRLIVGLKPENSLVTGQILWNSQDLLTKPIYEIAKMGIFLSWQSPPDLTGITLASLAKAILPKLSSPQVIAALNQSLEFLGLDKTYISRELDLSLSGGERKKIELLQILLLKPSLVILDEIDSGLDIQALELISKVHQHPSLDKTQWLIISHRLELVESIKPDQVLLLKDGKISKVGGLDLAREIIKNQEF